MGISGKGLHRLGFGALQCHASDGATTSPQFGQLLLQPKPRSDQNLVISAAAGMDLAADVAELCGQELLDGAVSVLETRIKDKDRDGSFKKNADYTKKSLGLA